MNEWACVRSYIWLTTVTNFEKTDCPSHTSLNSSLSIFLGSCLWCRPMPLCLPSIWREHSATHQSLPVPIPTIPGYMAQLSLAELWLRLHRILPSSPTASLPPESYKLRDWQTLHLYCCHPCCLGMFQTRLNVCILRWLEKHSTWLVSQCPCSRSHSWNLHSLLRLSHDCEI